MKTIKRKISFCWKEKNISAYARVGAMYCFKYCGVNQF